MGSLPGLLADVACDWVGGFCLMNQGNGKGSLAAGLPKLFFNVNSEMFSFSFL